MLKARSFGLCCLLLGACGGTETEPGGPPPVVAPTLQGLTVSLDLPMLEVSQSQAIKVDGRYSDGTTVSLLDKVELSITGEAAVLDRSNGVVIKAVAPGTAVLKATFEGQSAESTLTVVPARLVSIAIAGELVVGTERTIQLTATGAFADESTQDLTQAVTWSVSDETLAKVEGPGTIKGLKAGAIEVVAELEGVRGTSNVGVECRYPAGAPATFLNYEMFPNLSWEGAFFGDGTKAPFSMEQFYCDAQYAEKETLVLLIMAGWCPNCPAYLQRITAIAEELEASGALLVHVEAETESYGPANSAYAHRKVNSMGGQSYGIRIGDADTEPMADTIRTSPILEAYPSVWIYRKRDMKMIATQSASDYYLPLQEIVDNPEWNWRDPLNPLPSFESQCTEGQDEASEPNDTLATAASLNGPALVDGGICTDAADYYRIDVPGRWRFTIQFQNATGNLDLDLWNASTGRPVTSNNQPVGSFSTRNAEAYQGEGPGMIRVYGVNGASAPYRLFFEVL